MFDDTTLVELPPQGDFYLMPSTSAIGWPSPTSLMWTTNNVVQPPSSDEGRDWTENLETLFGHITSSEQHHFVSNDNDVIRHVVDDSSSGSNNDPTDETSGAATNRNEGPKLHSSGVKYPPKSRPRRQNHSCDPCRVGKKACDLFEHKVAIEDGRPTASCSTCKVRGLDCTASWLASRQSTQQIKKRGRTSCNPLEKARLGPDDTPLAAEVSLLGEWAVSSEPDQELVRQFAGRAATTYQFNVYIDAIDVPLTDQLSGGCMPPRFPLGFAVLPRLNGHSKLSPYISQAQTWVKGCWDTSASSWSFPGAAPHLFFAVSFLDSIFQQITKLEHSSTGRAREVLYNDLYKWVALASASQFSIHRNGNEKHASREVASATWHKAKSLLFQNISATGSFRQALSLLLFGTISPPPSKDGDPDLQADADFAHCEGVRRLQWLCAQAAAYLRSDSQGPRCKRRSGVVKPGGQPHPVHALAPEVKDDLLELVGALEWLGITLNSVSIVITRGNICAIPPEQCTGDRSCLLVPRESPPEPSESTSIVPLRHEERLNDSIVARAKAEKEPVTTLVRSQNALETMRHAISRSGSLVILIYKSLACLTMAVHNMEESEHSYNDVHKYLLNVFALVELWRTTFGKFDGSTTSSVQRSAANVRSMIFACAGDGDLAVLLLYKLLCRLSDEIREHPASIARDRLAATIHSMWTSYQEHRVASATQVSSLASTIIEGTKGQKTYFPDIASHPYPALVVQAHTLAAEAFTDEIQACIMNMNTQRAAEMASGLNLCLQGLDGLKHSLVNFPNVHSHDEQPDSWHLQYST